MSELVVFRCDADAATGGGHVMRCLALGDAFSLAGAQCRFATRPTTFEVIPTLAERYPVLTLDGAPGDEPSRIADRFAEASVLVIDHYGRNADFEHACRAGAKRIVALDDAPTRTHDCDLLVCPTPPWSARDFTDRVPADAKVLIGPAYAPLRAAFADRRFAISRPQKTKARPRLLVAFGATDPADATGRIIKALDQGQLLDGLTVDVMLGRGAPHRAKLETLVRDRSTVRLHLDPPEPAELMAQADLAIGAAGTMAWERCALGLPSIVVSIADNQRPGAAFLAQVGAAIDLGPLGALSDQDLVAMVRDLLGNDDVRDQMALAAATLCDGLGAARLVAAVAPPRATDGAAIALRPAAPADGERILDWQRHPDTRRFARNPAPPDLATHTAWMTQTLHDPHRILSVIEHGGVAAGVVRLDRLDDESDREIFEVSILIAPERKRLGLGRAALDLAHRLRPAATLFANVFPDNAASHALFRSAGYSACRGGYKKPPERSAGLEVVP